MHQKKIFGSAGALPSRKVIHHSLIASRHSLPFRLGRSLALPFLASSLVPRPTTCFKSVAMKRSLLKQAEETGGCIS
jgi:hypothetical protein